MGLIDKLFGPPSKDKFARMFIAALRQAGDQRSLRYDAEQFRLIHEQAGKEAGTTNLANMYLEYCQLPRTERDGCLRKLMRASLSHLKEMPDDFADASHDLRPKLWARTMFERLRLEAELQGHKPPRIPSVQVGEHLLGGLVYDLPEAVRTISHDDLDDWGATFYEAMEIARHNLETVKHIFAKLGDSLFASATGDTYDGSRLLLLDLIRKLEVQGDHVAMVPNRDTLLITGTDDEVGLGMMLDLGEKALANDPRPLTGLPVRLDGELWVDWMPAPEYAAYPRLKMLEAKYLLQEYQEQKELLEALHQKRGIDQFVATYSAVSKDDGRVSSYCVWSDGLESLLPRTEKLLFFREGQDIVAAGAWERVQEIVGDLLEPIEAYPPRYRVVDFPSESQLAAIGKEEL